MAVQKWLGDSFCGLVSVANKLGDAARSFEFGKFQLTLRELGMKDDEIADLWNGIDTQRSICGSWKEDDRNLSARCGILLNGALFPQNLLLYRLVSLLYPDVLVSVSVRAIASKRKLQPGRWEFAGEGEQKVLNLRFPTTPKKKSSSGRRLRRPYSRAYLFD